MFNQMHWRHAISSGSTEVVIYQMCCMYAAVKQKRNEPNAAATADRAAFEAQEARMAAELQQRTHQERSEIAELW